ncbi:MAG: hypothetical protein ACXVNM_14495 [Bacteroidia bacterium]
MNRQSKQVSQLHFDLNEFFGQGSIEKAAELFDRMQLPLIRGTQTGINVRNLNNWVTVLDPRDNSRNKVYSFAELIWYKIVEQLREAGLSLTIIASFKKELLAPIDSKAFVKKFQTPEKYFSELNLTYREKKHLLEFLAGESNRVTKDSAFSMLYVMIVECVIQKLPLALAVFLDGSFLIIDSSKEHLFTESDKKRLMFDTHVFVSLTKILNTFLLSELAGDIIPKIGLLSPAESKLIELVHNGEYESITINFKDKKIKSLELKKKENPKEQLIDILNSGEFNELIVKKRKGEIVKIDNTIKITL